MKPERKEQLQQNSLESWLRRLDARLGTLKQQMPALVACLVVIGFGGAWFVAKSVNDSRNAAAWQDLFQVTAPPSAQRIENEDNYERIKEFIANQEAAQGSWLSRLLLLSDNSHVIAWAKLKSANLALAMGINEAYSSNKERAKEKLDEACENYEAARGLTGATTELRREALYGLARACETKMAIGERNRDENRDAAVEHYQDLKKLEPESTLAVFATERIAQLSHE